MTTTSSTPPCDSRSFAVVYFLLRVCHVKWKHSRRQGRLRHDGVSLFSVEIHSVSSSLHCAALKICLCNPNRVQILFVFSQKWQFRNPAGWRLKCRNKKNKSMMKICTNSFFLFFLQRTHSFIQTAYELTHKFKNEAAVTDGGTGSTFALLVFVAAGISNPAATVASKPFPELRAR